LCSTKYIKHESKQARTVPLEIAGNASALNRSTRVALYGRERPRRVVASREARFSIKRGMRIAASASERAPPLMIRKKEEKCEGSEDTRESAK
jgi:hypothetical protein